MDWKQLGGKLAQAGAPLIGTALGGPLGGIIGGAIGNILANALGTEATPEAVDEALETTPSDALRAKLSAAESEALAKWPALATIAQAEAADRTAQAQVINATMQAEAARGLAWWAWRNLFGYMVTGNIGLTSLIILHELFTGDTKAISAFTNLTGFFMSWYGMQFGLLGYIHRGASNEKIAAVTGEAPSIVGKIVKAVSKR